MRARTVLPGLLASLLAGTAGAQGVRITGTTTVDYVDVQPLVMDSVLATATVDTGLMRHTPNGIIVECLGSDPYCRYFRSASRVSTAPLLQDLEVSAWGLGTGISVYAHARARASFGSASDIWPRANDHLDLLAGYAELDRERLRARLGRQWTTSALGYYAYDGASLLLIPRRELGVELYGGWGLAQGIAEPPTSSAISAVEDLPPDARSYVFGGSVRYRAGYRGGATFQYQREIRTDRAALYSERIAASGDLLVGRAQLDAGFVNDLATGAFNDAHVGVRVPYGQWSAGAQLRHYVPFFELWTIWGVFSPVGYNEASVQTAWTARDQIVSLGLSAGYRSYGNTNAGLGFLPLRTDGWQIGANGSWRVAPAWTATGGYRVAIGFGASRNDFDAGLRWHPGTRASLGVTGTAFQSIDEFTVGTGRVLGLALTGGLTLSDDARANADIALYHHTGEDTPQVANWNQRRASLWIQWAVGHDPGLSAGSP